MLMVVRGARAAAQSDPLAAARTAMDHFDAATARRDLEPLLRADPDGYEANWRMAVTLMDLGKVMVDPAAAPTRDSLYARAEFYARRAVAANPDGADGQFALAAVLGRIALSRGTRERIHLAAEIRDAARRAIALDPTQDGAYHVLGRWNAEVERLSGIDRFIARHFLGGAVFADASWDNAERDLRLAVRYAPSRIYHRLDLAEVLVDRHEWRDAAAQLDTLVTLPDRDPLDPRYKARARELMDKLREHLPS
jgi:tetratricopeptide (TPR) repeat protein